MADLYFTSDIHSYIYPTDYASPCDKNMGYAHLSSHFKEDSIIIDGGDVLQGSPLIRYEIQNGVRPFFISDIFNSAHLDVFVLGNHDFNFGKKVLADFIDSLNADVVCANLSSDLNIKRYVVKETKDGLRILITGVVTDYVNIWETKETLEGLKITDSVKEAKRVLEETQNEKFDYKILVYHGGFSDETGSIKENRGDELSKLGYDILLTAHQHMVIEPQHIGTSLVLQTGAKGEKCAHIKMSKNSVVAELLDTSLSLPLKKEIKESLEKRDNERIEINKYLSSCIGTIDFSLEDNGKLESGINGSSLANFINNEQLKFVDSDISACSLFNEEVSLHGDISYSKLFAAYPFSNTLLKLEIDGVILKEAMERSASYFDLDNNGEICISSRFLVPKVEHYNYDFYYGVAYTFDISKPIGQRVVRILYKDVDLLENPEYKLSIALNSYRATGTGGYDCYKRAVVLKRTSEEVEEILINAFEKNIVEEPKKVDFLIIK